MASPEHAPPSIPSSPLTKRPKTSKDVETPEILSEPHRDFHQANIMANTNGIQDPFAKSLAINQAAATASRIEPLQVKLLNGKAKIPTKGSAFAAGYDLYSAEATTLPARGQALVSTQIAIAVPPGTYGRVAPRSGLAVKHSLTTGAGVIDYDYRGEVRVLLYNLSDKDFAIAEGDRIAQLVLERIVTPDVVVMEELEGTLRGAGGFGSTGGFGESSSATKSKKTD